MRGLSVIEIGGGYGNMARLVGKAYGFKVLSLLALTVPKVQGLAQKLRSAGLSGCGGCGYGCGRGRGRARARACSPRRDVGVARARARVRARVLSAPRCGRRARTRARAPERAYLHSNEAAQNVWQSQHH